MPELNPWIAEAVVKRRAGSAPNYDRVHVCPKCSRKYLCPDRYGFPRCEPSAFAESKGWNTEGYSCGTCIDGYDAVNLEAWWEAHGILDA